MKKIIIVLVIILSAVMFLGIKHQRSSLYDPRELEKVNSEMRSKLSALDDEEVVQGTAQVENTQVTEDLPPQIETVYPFAFNEGDIIESDKIHLKFSDDNKVVRAIINNQETSTEEAQITEEGLYIVEIQDDTGKITILTFTFKHKPQEPQKEITQSPKATTHKQPSKSSEIRAKNQAAKEKAEQEARVKAEQEARVKAEQEARVKAEQEARVKAEQEAREKAEQEAREKAEQEAREKAEQEAREKAEQEAKEKAEQEAKEKAEQEAKEQVEKDKGQQQYSEIMQ